MHSVKLLVYYAILSLLPSARLTSLFSKIRVWYFQNVFKIMDIGGNPAMIGRNVYIANAKRIKFGTGCRINENVYIESATIGNDVLIAPNVKILSREHEHEDVDIPISMQGYKEEKPITIANNVWIGRNAIILAGVKIGTGVIVGAGAVVTKDIEDYAVVGGVPATFIKSRKNIEPEVISKPRHKKFNEIHSVQDRPASDNESEGGKSTKESA